MARAILTQLTQVRRRQQWLFVIKCVALGSLASATAGIVLALLRSSTELPVAGWMAPCLLTAGPMLGIFIGLAWRRSWHSAAVAVDACYDLKDRAVTALEFLEKPAATPLHELQLRDAIEHLTRVEPRRVVPLRPPKSLAYAAAALAVAVTALVWPTGPRAVEASPSSPLPEILAEAAQIEEDLNEFDELAKRDENKELEKLVEMLREKVADMKVPGVDLREALAKLSEMQSAIQAQQAQYNVELVDAQLESLGAGMSISQALSPAGQSLVEGKFDKAAEELEKIDEPELDRKEAKAVEEKLKKSAQEMGEVGLGSLSDASSEMAEGVKGAKGKFKSGAVRLAKEVRNHQRRKKINDLLTCELDRLCECKCNCEKNSLVKGKKPQKSTSPSNSFGMATSGNVRGDQTSLLSKKNLEQISGAMADEGASEVETSHSPEGRQQAGRGYRDVYQKYRSLSESVLDSEPIPLGHRQTIRRYFELIRPDSEN